MFRFATHLACLLITFIWLSDAAGKPTGEIASRELLDGPVKATLVRVRDGDSIEVLAHIWPGQRIAVSVRLRGIDAPELRARCSGERAMATRARAHLARLISDPTVSLRRIAGGKYFGRILADVTTEQGHDIANEMLISGFAVPYRNRKGKDWCATKPAAIN